MGLFNQWKAKKRENEKCKNKTQKVDLNKNKYFTSNWNKISHCYQEIYLDLMSESTKLSADCKMICVLLCKLNLQMSTAAMFIVR